jgi:hypothetical protein
MATRSGAADGSQLRWELVRAPNRRDAERGACAPQQRLGRQPSLVRHRRRRGDVQRRRGLLRWCQGSCDCGGGSAATATACGVARAGAGGGRALRRPGASTRRRGHALGGPPHGCVRGNAAPPTRPARGVRQRAARGHATRLAQHGGSEGARSGVHLFASAQAALLKVLMFDAASEPPASDINGLWVNRL